MKILFIHQNFPGQFKNLAPMLARQGHDVVAMSMNSALPDSWQGIRIVKYGVKRGTTRDVHPWVQDTETKVIRGEAAYFAARQLTKAGFEPDLIIGHPGWGETLFITDVWPNAKLGLYFEFFYHANGADLGFDSEFSTDDEAASAKIRAKNFNNLLHFDLMDGAICPTHWQASTYPTHVRNKIRVVHDGIDTDALTPNDNVKLQFVSASGKKINLDNRNEVITYVSRNLEPARGYHQFMRALPRLLTQRPEATVLIVGGDDVSYGARPDSLSFGGRSWKQIFIDEVAGQITQQQWERVHFLGKVPYQQFVAIQQISKVHVYLTYPFVLSWSLLEAMSIGCAIVASSTQPVQEAIQHDMTGRLVDFFDPGKLVEEICELLSDTELRLRLGTNARESAKRVYDLKRICLPRQMEWIESFHV